MPQKAGVARSTGELGKCRAGRRLTLTSLAVAAANPWETSGGRFEIEKGLEGGRWIRATLF
jgi:hypothetical protein